MQKISVQPTAKECFQSKRWNTLKKKGKLVDELNKPHMMMNNFDFNQIRAKAIKFGSAIDPQNARKEHTKVDEKTKREQIKKEVGKIDTKMLQNKLQNALKHKLTQNQNDQNDEDDEEEEEKKYENDNDDDDDLSKYRKMLEIGVNINAIKNEMSKNNVPQPIIDQFVIEHGIKNDTVVPSSQPAPRPNRALPNSLMAAINANNIAPIPAPNAAPVGANNNNGPPPAPIPTAAPIPAPIPAAAQIPPPAPIQHGYGVNNGMVSSSIIPKQHNNAGLVWKKAFVKYKNIERTVRRLKLLCHGLDIELERRRNGEHEIYGDNDQNDDDDEEKEEKTDFYDDSFTFYMTMIDRLDNGLTLWMNKHEENTEIVKKLEIAYHSKFRPLIFKSLTSTRYNALSVAANSYDEDMFVPDDIIGVIWMFVKPFDELIELKFAVDAITQFFDSQRKKIVLKKLPIQSHRGYEAEYQLI